MKTSRYIYALFTATLSACIYTGCVAPPRPPKPPDPTPAPATTIAFDLVACESAPVDNYCDGPSGARFTLHVKAPNPTRTSTWCQTRTGTRTSPSSRTSPTATSRITADGFNVLGPQHLTPADLVKTNDAGQHNFFTLTPAHADPSGLPLEQLAAIRGGMWPLTDGACGNLPIGPRPHDPTNVIATVFITDYSSDDQDCIIGELKRRGYTHVVMGPLVDSDGYHGTWQPNDWRGANFDRFLDAVQKFWDAAWRRSSSSIRTTGASNRRATS
jgi:hypothetical protein